jgi:glycosyltransferase involved in cell wall biosynthesis
LGCVTFPGKIRDAKGAALKIILIGTFAGKTDEGMRSISNRIFQELCKQHDVLVFNTWESLRLVNVRRIRRFGPHVIHYLNGPTIRSLVVLRILRMLTKKARCIASATRPFFSAKSRWVIPFFRPDLILTQSARWEELFRRKGIRVTPLANGVDLDVFQPVSSKERRNQLRRNYGIPEDKFVVLHVGHIRSNRGIEIFIPLQQLRSAQCVIVGSTSMNQDISLRARLLSAGCIVIDRFIDNIEELFQASDCYVFCAKEPMEGKYPKRYQEVGVIDTPLSVLEAMACNLLVITTRIGSLPSLFVEEKGFAYYDGSEQNLLEKVREEMEQRGYSKTREMIVPYDWRAVAGRLNNVYAELTGQRSNQGKDLVAEIEN